MISRNHRPLRLAKVGDIYTFAVPGGRYGACQVIGTAPHGQVELLVLDCLVRRRLTPRSAGRLHAFRQPWANWPEGPHRTLVPQRVPWWLELVVTLPPIERFEEPCRAVGGWHSSLAVHQRESWLLGAKRRWAPASSSLSLDLGGGPALINRSASRLVIGGSEGVPVPTKGRIDFSALDALSCLTELVYFGSDQEFGDYVASRKIPTVEWRRHGQRSIDLRSGWVTTLTLDVDEPLALEVPESLSELTVHRKSELLEVDGARLDFPFRLALEGPHIRRPPRGLESAPLLSYFNLTDCDTTALTAYTSLAELTLYGAPGRIVNASGLAALPHLHELSLNDIYGFDVPRWPSVWPSLDGLRVHGTRRSEVAALKKLLAHVPDVHIAGARSDEWVETNLNNPLRAWDFVAPAFGRGASAAWATARKATTKLGRRAPLKDRRQVLKDFVSTLNALGERYDIDTLRREEAGEALVLLAGELGINSTRASEWFDAWRDF